MEGIVRVRDIAEYFKLEQLTGDNSSLDRIITVPEINRLGLEFIGYFVSTVFARVVLLGNKEIGYITNKMTEEQVRELFDIIMSEETPCIIIARGHECPAILREMGNQKNFPILSTKQETTRVITDVVSFLDERLAKTISLHGTFLNIYGKGILLIGKSGSGKSEIALELIRKGHQLIADDRVDVKRVHNSIIGEAPFLLKGMLEIRGIGIIDAMQMFGVNSILRRHTLDYVIDLEKWDQDTEYVRAGIEDKEYKTILDVDIPMITLPMKEGRSIAVIIESAVTNFALIEEGYDSAKAFDERIRNYILAQNKKED